MCYTRSKSHNYQ